MSNDGKAQAVRKTGSLTDRLDELKAAPEGSDTASATDAKSTAVVPPPLPDPKPSEKAPRSANPPEKSPPEKSPPEKSPPEKSKINPDRPATTATPPPIPSKDKPAQKPAAALPLADKPSTSAAPAPTSASPSSRKASRVLPSGLDAATDVPAGIRPEPRHAGTETETDDVSEIQRRAAQRRPAGPSRERIAANDDAPSIGGLIYALNQRPSNRPFGYAAGATGLWFAIALGFAYAFMLGSIDWSAGLSAVVTHPAFLSALATLIGPIMLFWFVAFLLWRADELHLRSTAMTEVAVRLAEPDRMAEQSVASLGQAVRRQVSFMNDAVTRALGRAGELEALVHREVTSLEQSYEDNERKIRGLIKELASERGDLLSTGDRFKDTLLELGTEVPQLIDKLSTQQARLAQIIDHAGSNLTQLESAIGSQTDRLESSLGNNTDRLQGVLADYTGALAGALGSRTDEMQTMLSGYTEALGGALENRTQQMQGLLEDNRKAMDTSLGSKTEQMQTLLDGNRNAIDKSLGEMTDTLANRTETMQVIFEEYGRALDETLADRAQTFDMQLVDRTKALDDAFTERLRLFDEAIMRSTLSIDQAVGDNAKALTSALETHAESFSETLADQAVQLDDTLVRGIDAVRASSENISRQSIKAIEGLAGQSDMLRNVSENLLNQISSVSNRFESQGHAIMRSANALESANYRIDKMLADRSDELNTTLDRMSGKANELGSAFAGYTQNLEGSIENAHERAKLLTEDLNRETEQQARAAVDHLQRMKEQASREADQALDDLRSEFSSVSREVSNRLGSLSDQFSQTTGEVRQHAARAAQELEAEQSRLKQQLDLMPKASEENAIAMRKALQDQLKALDQLSELAQRTAVTAAAVPPSTQEPIALREVPEPRPVAAARERTAARPLTSLTNTLAREMNERQSRQAEPSQQHATAAPPQQQQAAVPQSPLARAAAPRTEQSAPQRQQAIQGSSQANWSLGDLLARVSVDDGGSDPEPSGELDDTSIPAPPADAGNGGIDIGSLARALDPGTAGAIWSRFRNGQRGFMVRSIYAPESRQMFDDIVYRYQNEPAFRANVDQFVREFERTLRDSDQQDTGGELTQSQIMSDAGRVYLLFAHASQRLV